MATVYNVEAARDDLVFTKGDTINITLTVLQNSVAFDMTGGALEMDVVTLGGSVHRTFTSSGTSPTITILTNTLTIYSATAFTTAGGYKYDIQFTSAAGVVSTIMKGYLIVEDEVTI